MDPRLHEAIRNRDEVAIENMFFDGGCPHCFAVDWREDDQSIVTYCADCLNLDTLTADWIDDRLVIVRDGRSVEVPLICDEGDRHNTICTLNDVLTPEFEIRMLVCSHGSDTAGFCVLPRHDWNNLDAACPEMIAENFLRLSTLPSIFTELNDEKLPAAARARIDRMIDRNRLTANSQATTTHCRTNPCTEARLARLFKWMRGWFGLGDG